MISVGSLTSSLNLLDDIVERNVFAIVKFVQLVAHVLEEKPVFLRVNLKSSFEKTKNELDSSHRNHTSLMDVHNVPSILEVSDVGIGQQRVFFVGVEQGKVLHDNSCGIEEWFIDLFALHPKMFPIAYPQVGSKRCT